MALTETPEQLDWLRAFPGSPFIDGSVVPGLGASFGVEDPSTGEDFTTVEGASRQQYDEAVRAARRAFESGCWSGLTLAERVQRLGVFSDLLDSWRQELAEAIVAEVGTPVRMAQASQVGLALECARDLPRLAAELPEWEHNELPLEQYLAGNTVRLSIRRYEPVGVVAAITPFNYPLAVNIFKIVPAMAVGCCVVLRPSPLTPLSALILGRAAEEAGIPPGVLNVVVDDGSMGGEVLSTHLGVDLVSFTGSISVGRLVATQAAPSLKRVILELGGKSVQIHRPDVLESGLDELVGRVSSVFVANAGQGCSLQTRVLVPQATKAEVLEALAAAAARQRVGDPRDPATTVGPVISRAQRDRIHQMVQAGISQGGRLVAGGSPPADLERGWFYLPTVVDLDDNANVLAQQEVFGPVVTVQGYRDDDEAVAIANDSEYGLAGAVYTRDLARGRAMAEQIRSGTVHVNQGAASAYAAIGGYKQSGIGRERGVLGLRAFQESKHIVVGEG